MNRAKYLVAFLFCAVPACNSDNQPSRHSNVVCRKSSIHGFDDCYRQAKPLVGEATSDIAKMKVYITVSRGAIYAHSNFQTPGSAFPTKIATSESIDALNLVYNLVGENVLEEGEVRQAVRDKVIFIVDKKAMKGTGPTVAFDGGETVYSADDYAARGPLLEAARRLTESRDKNPLDSSEMFVEALRRARESELAGTKVDSVREASWTELATHSTADMHLFRVTHTESGSEILTTDGLIRLSNDEMTLLKRGERLNSAHPLTETLFGQQDGAFVLFTREGEKDIERSDDLAFAIQRSYPEKRIFRDPFSDRTKDLARLMNQFTVSSPSELLTVIAGDSFEVTDWKIIQNIEPNLRQSGFENVRVLEKGQIAQWDGAGGKAVVVITGHIDDRLATFIQELGEAGYFKNNAVLLDTCRMPATRGLATTVCNEYGAFGVFCYDSKIEAAAVEDFVLDMAAQIKAQPKQAFVDLINGVIGKHGLNGIWTLCKNDPQVLWHLLVAHSNGVD